jgi:hypothetical protein
MREAGLDGHGLERLRAPRKNEAKAYCDRKERSMLTRRRFLKFMAGAGALLPLKWRTRSYAAIRGGTLDPTTILKYTEPLIIPPAMPMTRTSADLDYYEIAVRQFEQQILPTGYPATTVWSYGSISHPGALNYPAFTIEAVQDRPVRVRWVNDLVDAQGNFLPHLLPVDPTLIGPILPAASRGATPGPSSRRRPVPTRVQCPW